MELLHRIVGPAFTNVWVLGEEASREAIAVDTATPSAPWVLEALATQGWTLKLIVSTHRHWDHIGDNTAVADATGAQIAVHTLDRHGLEHPVQSLGAPFTIVPSLPAVELAEGGLVAFGTIRLEVLHTPGHTEGSVCLLEREAGLLFSGDTLFAGAWGRTDLPGGDDATMVDSISRLARLEPTLQVFPGHGSTTTIERERSWMDLVARQGRLFA
jgi:glyoxylase-like metal-dependent hydrolase (beta-lactamase superfamily II)